MKILNLYAGIGGNRKLWGDEHEITAIEYKPEIAKIYQEFFPKDTVIVADAHEYLLKHFAEYDFIWASPPCPTHSRARFAMANSSNEEFKEKYNQKPVYPSMTLYQEILFLKHYFKGKWCVENVIAFYKPLIPPCIGRSEKGYCAPGFRLLQIKTKNKSESAMKINKKTKTLITLLAAGLLVDLWRNWPWAKKLATAFTNSNPNHDA